MAEKVAPRLRRRGFDVRITIHHVVGDSAAAVGAALCAVAQQRNASLLLITRVSTSAVRKLLLGSVSRYVSESSTVPVLIC